jgi:hypothetical protein
MMTITIAWNGGQNVAMFSPSTKVWVAIFAIFTVGIVSIGGSALALVAGAGYLLCSVALLAFHALTAAIYSSVFSFAFSLFLCAGLLVLFVVLCFRVFGIHSCKGGAA